MSNKIDLTGYKKVRMGFLTFFCEQKEDGRLVIRYLKGFHNSVPALEVPGDGIEVLEEGDTVRIKVIP